MAPLPCFTSSSLRLFIGRGLFLTHIRTHTHTHTHISIYLHSLFSLHEKGPLFRYMQMCKYTHTLLIHSLLTRGNSRRTRRRRRHSRSGRESHLIVSDRFPPHIKRTLTRIAVGAQVGTASGAGGGSERGGS
jgi:hypothetical protein